MEGTDISLGIKVAVLDIIIYLSNGYIKLIVIREILKNDFIEIQSSF